MKRSKASRVAPGTFKRVLKALAPYGLLIALSLLSAAATVALSLYLPVQVEGQHA